MDARWIFAFDGNSFLTKNAMEEIKHSIRKHGEVLQYFVVPMARLVDNSQLLKGVDTRPNSKEEPQIIFRNDAEDVYNPDMRYGRRSKVCAVSMWKWSCYMVLPSFSHLLTLPLEPFFL